MHSSTLNFYHWLMECIVSWSMCLANKIIYRNFFLKKELIAKSILNIILIHNGKACKNNLIYGCWFLKKKLPPTWEYFFFNSRLKIYTLFNDMVSFRIENRWRHDRRNEKYHILGIYKINSTGMSYSKMCSKMVPWDD